MQLPVVSLHSFFMVCRYNDCSQCQANYFFVHSFCCDFALYLAGLGSIIANVSSN